ncbi:MAG: T9SS type A sorting domain-containing protein [Flavobacteriales bacterium]
MNLKNIFTTLCFLILSLAFCQEHDWDNHCMVVKTNAPGYDVDMAIDSEDNIIVIGRFETEIELGDTILFSDKENGVFVAKFTKDYQLLWSKKIADSNIGTRNHTPLIDHLGLNTDGNAIYTTIGYRDSIHINNNLHTITYHSFRNANSVVVKLSPSGDVLDEVKIGGTCGNTVYILPEAEANQLFLHTSIYPVDIDTNAICSCTINGDTILYFDYPAVVVSKIESDTTRWVTPYTTDGLLEGRHMAKHNDKLYISGWTQYAGHVFFPDYTLQVPSHYSKLGYVAQLGENGQVGWARHFGAKGWDTQLATYGITISSENDILVVGNNHSQSVLNKLYVQGVSDLVGLFNSEMNFFIINYDIYGQVNWHRLSNGIGHKGVGGPSVIDSEKNIYLGGEFNREFVFNQDTITPISLAPDGFIVSYDKNGNKRWAKSNGGLAYDVNYRMAVNSVDEIYVLGFSRGNPMYFGSIENTDVVPNSFFINRLNLQPLNIDDPELGIEIDLSPNPNTGHFAIKTHSNHPIKRLELYDELGILVKQYAVNGNHFIINAKLANGLYFVKIETQTNHQIVKKMSVE